jgi:hypothetical protein
MAQQTACWIVLALDAAGDRRISRSPSFAVDSRDFILNRPSDVDEEIETLLDAEAAVTTLAGKRALWSIRSMY